MVINMAQNYDKQEYNKLNSQKQSNEIQQNECQKEIYSLDEKIDRLKSAYNAIGEVKEDIDNIKNKNKNMWDNYKSIWKGKRADYFNDLCESGELKESYSGYVNNIDSVEDNINWEINKLREEQNEKYGVLSGLVNAWDDLCTKIQNFFN